MGTALLPPGLPDLEPAAQPDPEALIEEARARQRRRRVRIALAVGVAAAIAFGVYALLAFGDGGRAARAGAAPAAVAGRHCPPVDLGSVAFLRGGALDVVDLRGCTTRTLVRAHAAGPVQFSADGRYIAFDGGYVAARGGAVTRTRGAGTWSPASDLLAVVTTRGGLDLLRPGAPARRVLPDGFGALTVAFAPDGRALAVSRSLYSSPSVPASRWHQEIWRIDVATGARRLLYRLPPGELAPAWLQGYSPDGRWLLFWEDSQNSASLAADGLPLVALPARGGESVTIANELHYSDYLTWCGDALVYVIDRGGRQVTLGDGVAVAKPPLWRSRTVLPVNGRTSWNAVACPTAPPGGLVVAGGPKNDDEPFGQEHRSLWLVSPSAGATPERLSQTIPPAGWTDELPMWSRDGRWILFVRTKPLGAGAGGKLYALDPFGGNLVGPIANVGSAANYYGSYSWPTQLDWHR